MARRDRPLHSGLHRHGDLDCRSVFLSVGETFMTALTPSESYVLANIHDAPYIEPAKQTATVCGIIEALKSKGMLQASCLKQGALESSEKGAKALGYA